MGRPGGGLDLLVGGIGAAVRQILPDSSGKQPGLLQHHAEAAAQGIPCEGHNPTAVHLDCPAVHLIKPHEQIDEGGLACPGGADDRHGGAGPTFRLKSEIKGRSGEYANRTWENATAPAAFSSTAAPAASGSCSGSSMTAKTRRADAMASWSCMVMAVISLNGLENCTV